MKKLRLRPLPFGLWGVQWDRGRDAPPIYFGMGANPGRVLDRALAKVLSRRADPPPHKRRPPYPEH